MRLTGIRVGECIHLTLDYVRHIGPEQWALHVPPGKMHSERLVPLDAEGLRLINRIRELRTQLGGPFTAAPYPFLPLHPSTYPTLYPCTLPPLGSAARAHGPIPPGTRRGVVDDV